MDCNKAHEKIKSQVFIYNIEEHIGYIEYDIWRENSILLYIMYSPPLYMQVKFIKYRDYSMSKLVPYPIKDKYT